MILKIAWRNVWRSRLRSSVVIFAIMAGIWAGISMTSMSVGITYARTEDMINNFLSHIQIHNPLFKTDNKVQYVIDDLEAVENYLQQKDSVLYYAKRSIFREGLLASSKGNRNMKIVGVNPDDERKVSTLHNSTTEGNYFEEYKGRPVYVSRFIADKYDYEIGDKVILNYTDTTGVQHGTKHKVCGIFETVNSNHDESTLYVLNSDLFEEIGLELYHEIALVTPDQSLASSLEASMQSALPNQEVEYWGKVSPDLGYTDEMMDIALYIYMSIIMLALLFGIINTMLMAILERKRELGMLLSVGMKKSRVFAMIILETMFLALVGGPAGIIAGHFTVQYFGAYGLDLSVVAEGMKEFGMGSVIYPTIDPSAYIDITIMVIVTALIAALYPARKALKLKPAEAVRAI